VRELGKSKVVGNVDEGDEMRTEKSARNQKDFN